MPQRESRVFLTIYIIPWELCKASKNWRQVLHVLSSITCAKVFVNCNSLAKSISQNCNLKYWTAFVKFVFPAEWLFAIYWNSMQIISEFTQEKLHVKQGEKSQDSSLIVQSFELLLPELLLAIYWRQHKVNWLLFTWSALDMQPVLTLIPQYKSFQIMQKCFFWKIICYLH